MIARLLRQHGARRIEYCFYLPCVSLHATCCVDSDFLFVYMCILVCVCLQGCRAVLCHCYVCVLFDVMFSASVLVFVVCLQFQSCLVVVLAIGSSHVFDFCLHSYRSWLQNAVFILRTAKTDSSAETAILCHVCD